MVLNMVFLMFKKYHNLIYEEKSGFEHGFFNVHKFAF